MKQVLVMWSGGLDSTYVLYKYLIETDHPVMSHHIIIQDRKEFRWHQEEAAVNSIREWMLKNCRKFDYSESSYYNRLAGKDITLCLFMASQIVYNFLGPEINEIEVATGRVVEDDDRAPIHTQDDVFSAGIKDITVPTKIVRPIRHMTKREIMNDMPQELINLTWSCRTPRFEKGKAIPCGICHACKERNR